jgi:hypothetical protein
MIPTPTGGRSSRRASVEAVYDESGDGFDKADSRYMNDDLQK